MAIELAQFHDTFFEESFESLAAMEAAVLRLEAGDIAADTINTVFRVAHSLKGGAGMFGFAEIVSFTHTLEAVLDALRGNRLAVTPSLLDLLLQSVDLLRGMLLAAQRKEPVDPQLVTDLQFDLELVVARPSAPAESRAALPAQPAVGQGGVDAGSIRVSIDKLDELMNTVGEIVITQSMLAQLAATTPGLAERLHVGLAQLERNVRELQGSVLRVRMLPISSVFSRFPRLVRDLSQRLGKRIELRLTGEHTELDKTVLEKIGDPLVHLVRNSIDHGIETPDARGALGKPATGTVHLDARHRGGSIVVEVTDDGGGLDRARIVERARERGLIGAQEQPDDDAIHELIFLPGFTTAEQATDLSGRGVGMDVVRRNVKELGGSIEVQSTAGQGSRFTLTLPLTLAIVDGQTVAVGAERYVVPLIAIVESLQLKPGAAGRLAGSGGDVFPFRGDYLPVVRLHEVFKVEPQSAELHTGLIMVVEGDGRRVGLFVDGIEGQQQAVIKPVETNYRHIDGVSGATITGDGNVALILDVPGLVRAAGGRRAAVRA